MQQRVPSTIMFCLLAVLCAGCVHCTGPDRIASDALYKTWMELHEQRNGEVRTYHDPSYTFPVARGREGFTIRPEGEFIWHRIAPTDGTMNVPARWRFEDASEDVILVTEPATGDTVRIILLTVDATTLTARLEN